MSMTSNEASSIITTLANKAKRSMPLLAKAQHEIRNQALCAAARHIRQRKEDILNANNEDVEIAHKADLKESFIDRLTLDTSRIEAMAVSLEEIARLDDPLGKVLAEWERPNGLKISRVATPLGIMGVIYEARPNVTCDAAGLAIKAGNTVILRGGASSIKTATLLAELMRAGLAEVGLPEDAVQLIQDTDRALVGAMLTASGEIDVIIPRGGKSLVERVQNEARVPVFAHLNGICHVYIDADADFDKARAISVNAKMRRVGICGAAETLLVDKNIANDILPLIADDLKKAGCLLRCDAAAKTILDNAHFEGAEDATDTDWSTEYLDQILSVRLVDGVNGAIEHIKNYSSDHTESIITENPATANIFTKVVDSAIVMVNASTQFADGGEFGMGAEIGISTGRMHARGPVGAAQLTSFKYIVRGNGQTRP